MLRKSIRILSLETSCDETAAAVIQGEIIKKNVKSATPKILSNIIYSQLKIHQKTGGIVPEVASRAHTEKIIAVAKQALKKAKINLDQIDIIAVTTGPGLIGSLLVGIDTAKALSFIKQKPLIPINHILAHIYAIYAKKRTNISFPAVALIVSGGHTVLILIRGHEKFELIGTTIDDAAGESFDKVAKILGLPYPGGPAISAAAEMEMRNKKLKIKNKFQIHLPRPMINEENFNFSFSGLKTSVLYLIQDLGQKMTKKIRPQIAAEFQQAVVDVLVKKTIKAARKYQAKSIIIGGGVAANILLRKEMKKAVKQNFSCVQLYLPDSNLCTDNAAIIGLKAYFDYLQNKNNLKNWQKVNLKLELGL